MLRDGEGGSRLTPNTTILDYQCSKAAGGMLFHLLGKLYVHTTVTITTNLTFAEWSRVFGDAKMTTALLGRLTHY